MTNREFLTAIAAMENEELSAHATAWLEKMDAANAKRKEKPSKKALENAPLVNQIYDEVLSTETAMTASEVAAAMGEMSVQKASALLRILETEGRVLKGEKAVKGKGKQKTYTKVEGTVEDVETEPALAIESF